MGRGPTALCAVALLVSGCGGSGDAPAQRGERLTGTRDAGWASRAEVEWLRDVADWSAAFAEAGSAVGAFEAGARFDAAARVLAPIRNCARSFAAEVGDAPTARLAESERNFRDSAMYRSDECRDGGELDLEERSTRFP
jgi:hypothetical protein